MTKDSPVLTRRNALKGIGGLAGAGAIGLAMTGSAAAQASIDVNIKGSKISNDAGHVNYIGVDVSKTIKWSNFDKPVKYIGFKHEIALSSNDEGWHRLYPAPGAADDKQGDGFAVSPELPDWSNFGDDEQVKQYTTDANHYPDGTTGKALAGIEWEVINDTGEPGSYAEFGYDGGGPQDPANWADDVSVSEDGVEKDREVRFKSTLRFYDENKNVIADEDGIGEIEGQDTFVVTVTNEDGTMSGTGESGDSTTG